MVLTIIILVFVTISIFAWILIKKKKSLKEEVIENEIDSKTNVETSTVEPVNESKVNENNELKEETKENTSEKTEETISNTSSEEKEIPKDEDKEQNVTLQKENDENKNEVIEEGKYLSLDECINAFKDYISIPKGSVTYNYLKDLYEEVSAQVAKYTNNGIPLLYLERNFPVVTNYYGSNGNQAANFNTLVGWLFALQLSELKPKKRNRLFKVGYELGGYTYDSPVFGYHFETDPNIARLVASIIYVTMRAIKKPNISTMRAEVEGTSYPYGLSYYLDMGLNHLKTPEEIQKNVINKGGFYVDLREFMPSSAGPYAPGYTNRPPHVMTDNKDDYNNTKVDRLIHEYVVETFNLNNSDEAIRQMTVQAIADKEQSTNHLYGDNKTVKEFSFYPVFGVDTIDKKIKTDGAAANLTFSIQAISTYFRIILQSKAVNPIQYGRLRPGCSWEQEKKKNSDTDDRRNILTNIVIEDNDGQKTSSYGYNEDGIWVATPVERSEYEEHQKNNLGANSYPSGHSSGIWTVAMMLCEAMPYKADLIMQAANQFAINRTISRYHWTSDTINGRVLGSIASAMCHATSDYDTLLNNVKKELK